MNVATFANAGWFAANAQAFVSFNSALDHPRDTQRKLLMRYVRDNQGSAFGVAHGFADIRSPEDYQRQVPLADYDDHLPWINRIKDGEQNILTTAPGNPVGSDQRIVAGAQINSLHHQSSARVQPCDRAVDLRFISAESQTDARFRILVHLTKLPINGGVQLTRPDRF